MYRGDILYGLLEARRKERNRDKSIWLCPLCGNRYKAKTAHIMRNHLMTVREFEKFMRDKKNDPPATGVSS